MVHIGSWGLPDFGITEKIGDYFGLTRNDQGGSQLKGTYQPTTLAYSTPNMSYSPGTSGSAGTYSYTPQASTSTGGGSGNTGGGGSPSNPETTYVDRGDGTQIKLADLLRDQERLRGEIGGAWDSYLGSLDQQMNALPGQRGTLEGMVQNQYQSGVNDITGQKNLSLQDLNTSRQKVETEQKKTLTDLAQDLRNSFLAGNIYLGSRGAGDSSAANQYAYALQKMGNKNRGDVLAQSRNIYSDIDGREARLNEITNQEMNKLSSEREKGILEVAQWFENAQNQIRQAKSQGTLQKGLDLANLSRDLLNQATSRLQQLEDRFMNQKDALTQWAMGQAENINQLKSNLSQLSTVEIPGYGQYGSVGASTPRVDSQGNIVAAGYGYSDEDEKKRLI